MNELQLISDHAQARFNYRVAKRRRRRLMREEKMWLAVAHRIESELEDLGIKSIQIHIPNKPQ